ncbi:MAG: aminotransferase class I/II-fold pyridoxal phosphate-dependent enzyme [Cyanobacteriota bacterium]|nr:aminotransferase class I/II-fold pyridoxal phosphate-dependent enzyme [Cyanobacteriota bacterium]
MSDLGSILQHVFRHNDDISRRVDLVASNAWVSNWSRLALSSLLTNSYCIGQPGQRLYGGCAAIDALEIDVVRLATDLFGTRFGCVQFLSGMQANIAAYSSLLKPGDTIVAAPCRHGGHYSHNSRGPLRFFAPRVLPVPFDEGCYNIDVERLEVLLAAENPALLVVGWSEFLFPHPLSEIRNLCDRHGTRLMYDMSHVAGLLAGGLFQPEAGALADIVTSSTGKSLQAPDHGLCLFNDAALVSGIHDAVQPLLTSNTHPQELAALGVALIEMRHFGRAYAEQVIRNAQALARALELRGVPVLYAHLGYTRSHTILVRCAAADVAFQTLDGAGLSLNACALPWDHGDQLSGLRLGTQVVTRRGMKEAQMDAIAEAVAQVLVHGQAPEVVHRTLVEPLAREFQEVAYSFDDTFPLPADWQTPARRPWLPQRSPVRDGSTETAVILSA